MKSSKITQTYELADLTQMLKENIKIPEGYEFEKVRWEVDVDRDYLDRLTGKHVMKAQVILVPSKEKSK